MAHLLQAFTAIPDTEKFSYSGWVWLPSSPTPPSTVNLLQWGDPSLSWYSSLSLRGMSGTSSRLILEIIGPAAPLLQSHISDVDGGGSIGGGNIDRFLCGVSLHASVSTPKVIIPDQWNHIFASIDLTGEDTLTWTPSATITRVREIGLYVNGVNQLLQAGGFDTRYTTTYDDRLDTTTPRVCPRFVMAVNNFPLGMPAQATSISNSPLMRFGHVQVWFDTFIDPATDYDKFVTESDGRGRPASSVIAREEFGEQTLLFNGGAESFKTNRGSDGAFTKIGTLTNFSPTPSYTVP